MTNVAVIGTGNMGGNHARVYSGMENVKLIAISDISEAGRKVANRFGCKYYKDYREMLRKEDIDAISIAVPTKLHSIAALDCIENGINTLIEKPISESIESAVKVISAAEKKGTILTVGHIERFNPAIQKLKDIIGKGKLGETMSIISKRVGIYPSQIKDANVYLDLAVHDIDIFNYLMESPPDKIYSMASRALDSRREDHAMIFLSYGPTTCSVQVNWITPVKIRNLAVTGTKGYAELNYVTQDLKIYESVYERNYDSFGDFVVKFGRPKEMKVDVEKEEPLKVELMHFISCVENNERPLVTGEDALLALQLSLDAIKSYKSGKVIEVIK